jgi:predicted Ser/Thr protein kinase
MAINPMPAALSVNTLVNGRFRVKKVLGYGGYGNVYLVEDEIVFPGNQFALKESLSSTISEQRQFTREAKWLMTLEHSNLPRVAEQFDWNGRPYFVMAYVAGENLEDRVDRLGPLPEDQVLNWMLPICDAVIYLHTQKRPIIHRDIKPGNIIVGKDGRPWLVDFGIAKVLQSGGSRKTTRAARAVSGGYSPLEQYTRGGTDVRSDVYALGATLYHLLTGICPPEAPDIASGVARLPDARQVHSKITRQTEQVVMRAMQQKPEDRYQTVREMMNDLPGGRTFTINPNGTISQPVVTGATSKRGAKAKNAAAAAAATAQPVAAPATAVATPPPSFTPPPPAATFVGAPASSQYAAFVAQQPAASPARPQPIPQVADSTQAFAVPPPPQPVPAASRQAQGPRKRTILVGAVALLGGLAVLATMVLTYLYLTRVEQAPIFVLGYQDMWLEPDLAQRLLLVPIFVAALCLVILPVIHWLGSLGRGLTYTFLLLVTLAGLVPMLVWVADQPDTAESIFLRGFFLPMLLFVLVLVTTVYGVLRKR